MNTLDLLLFVRGECHRPFQVYRFDARGLSVRKPETPAGAYDLVLRERPQAVAICTLPGDGALELVHSLIRKLEIPIVSLVGGRSVGLRWNGEAFDPFAAYESAMRLILSLADAEEREPILEPAKVA